MNYEIFIVDGKQYRFHDTLLAIYGEPVDKKGNPIDGEWITMPKNEICRLFIDWDESLQRFFGRRWFYISVIGTVFGAIGLILFGPALVKAVMTEMPFGDLCYFGFLTLASLIDLVGCGGSLLYEIRSPRRRAEEELEE